MKKAIYTLASAALFGCSSYEDPVRINPEEPTVVDSLECYVQDSDVPYDFLWYKNGDLFQENPKSNVSRISDLELFVGDEWNCKVYIPDSVPMVSSSIYVGSDSVEVLE